MKNLFLQQAAEGKNSWWRYLATILLMIAGLIAINLIVGKVVLPLLKPYLPEKTDFSNEVMTFIFAGIVFGVALLSFVFAFRWLHKRKAMSLITTTGRFSWREYFAGFAVWGVLVFVGMLITDYDKFQTFINTFQASQFIILLVVGAIMLGIQSFTEEILFRGYFLQGTSLLFKRELLPVLINGLLFALLHFGYGISAFISTFGFGVAFSLITLRKSRIEFASGAHLVNNLLLSVIFIDLNEALNSQFDWTIDYKELITELSVMTILVLVVELLPARRDKKLSFAAKTA